MHPSASSLLPAVLPGSVFHKKPPTPHQSLVASLLVEGWNPPRNWRPLIREEMLIRISDPLDRDDLIEALGEFRGTPDAWRIVEEGEPEGWGQSVMVLEVAEVEVTYRLPKEKLLHYNDLWWSFDGSDEAHLRVWIINRFGHRQALIDTVPLYYSNR